MPVVPHLPLFPIAPSIPHWFNVIGQLSLMPLDLFPRPATFLLQYDCLIEIFECMYQEKTSSTDVNVLIGWLEYMPSFVWKICLAMSLPWLPCSHNQGGISPGRLAWGRIVTSQSHTSVRDKYVTSSWLINLRLKSLDLTLINSFLDHHQFTTFLPSSSHVRFVSIAPYLFKYKFSYDTWFRRRETEKWLLYRHLLAAVYLMNRGWAGESKPWVQVSFLLESVELGREHM